ncbi:hypothetical protein D3C80_875060 [compost metagenome]
MRVEQIFFRNDPHENSFHRIRCLGRCKPDPVAYAQNMRIYSHGRMTESHAQHNIGSLAPDTRQFHQFVAIIGNFTAIITDKRFRQQNDVLGLVTPKTNGADIIANRVFAQRQHFLRCVGNRKERARCLVYTRIRCLRRQDDSH